MTAADLSPDNLAVLEAKLRADLETVMRVRALLQEHVGGGSLVRGSPAAITPPGGSTAALGLGAKASVGLTFQDPPDVKVLVQEVVATLRGPFKIGQVKQRVSERYRGCPDTSIRSVLMRMVQTGKLKVVEQGRGRGGSTFQRCGEEAEIQADEAESVAL